MCLKLMVAAANARGWLIPSPAIVTCVCVEHRQLGPVQALGAWGSEWSRA